MKNYVKLIVYYDLKLCFLLFDGKIISVMSFCYSKLIFKDWDKDLYWISGNVCIYNLNKL